MTHADLLNAIMRALSRGDVRLFHNNVGTAWQGKVTHLDAGSILIQHPRPVHFGLAQGSADLIGWRSLEITPEHVGRTMAQFVSFEGKTGTGRLSPEQTAWRQAVLFAGGVAETVRSVEDAKQALLSKKQTPK